MHSLASKNQSGLSMVELLVAVAVGLMLLAGITTMFANSRQTYEANQRLARIQENGRFALEQIGRDVRVAGFKGCARRLSGANPFHNKLASPTTLLNNFAIPVEGDEWSTGTTWAPGTIASTLTSPAEGSDVFVVRRPRPGVPAFQVRTSMAAATDPIVVTDAGSADINVGDNILVSDCVAASVVRATGYSYSAPAGSIAHANGVNVDDSAGNAYTTIARAVVVDTVIYYVANNPAGIPSLYRQQGSATPEEIVEGVERMQITYGVDTNLDFWVDSYQTANQVNTAVLWDRVVSINIALLVRSLEPYGADLDTRTYDLLGNTVGPFNDRYQRLTFTTAATLRNNSK